MKRPQLTAMLEFVREGDSVFCHSMDRLGRNMGDLRKLVDLMTERGISVQILELAAREGEARVEDALRLLLASSSGKEANADKEAFEQFMISDTAWIGTSVTLGDKSHRVISQELVRRGHRMLFTTCEMLVQQLLVAKRDLKLSRVIQRYARYQGMIIDDLGYIRQTREEMEVVFTLLAERYERGSVLLTSNLPFSKWKGIFKDPMTTAAAIDRLVHHSVIVELNVPSYRLEQAQKNGHALSQELAAKPNAEEAASSSGLRPAPPPASSEPI